MIISLLTLSVVVLLLYLVADCLVVYTVLREARLTSPIPKVALFFLSEVATIYFSPSLKASAFNVLTAFAVGIAISAIYFVSLQQAFNWIIEKLLSSKTSAE